MKLQSAHPTPRRSKMPFVLLFLLVIVVGGTIYFSMTAEPQPTETIEEEIVVNAE